MDETLNVYAGVKLDKLERNKKIYNVVSNWETDINLHKLIEMGPFNRQDKRLYEMTLFKLLNDVIKRAYHEGLKNALLNDLK